MANHENTNEAADVQETRDSQPTPRPRAEDCIPASLKRPMYRVPGELRLMLRRRGEELGTSLSAECVTILGSEMTVTREDVMRCMERVQGKGWDGITPNVPQAIRDQLKVEAEALRVKINNIVVTKLWHALMRHGSDNTRAAE